MYTTLALVLTLAIVLAPFVPRLVRPREWLRGLGGASFASELGALTLAEAAKLSNDVVLQGVYESVLKASDISLVLPWEQLSGNAITYNRENAAPTVAYRDVGDTWTEGVATFTQLTKSLAILGGDADVDQYLQLSRSNVQDLRATILLGKGQALQRAIDDGLVNGSGAGTPTQMDGLDAIMTSLPASQKRVCTLGANGGSLTLNELDILIDMVQGSPPDFLMMSKRSRRSVNSLFRASGASMETRSDFGRFIQAYNTIPILLNDYISDAQTVGTSTDCTSIYAGKLGQEKGGLWAHFAGPSPIIIEDIGALETKDAWRTRVKSYLQLCQGSAVTLARLNGVRP